MKRSLALALFFLSALFARAQDPISPPQPPSISGIVVQEPDSQPLKKVLVQVVAENQKQGGDYTDSTDDDGYFRIENVDPGRYRIYLERTGFVGVDERGIQSDTNVVTVQAGQSLENLVFRMLSTAIINGRVTDEDGDPMSGVSVIAQKKRPGKATRESAASGTTNDVGEYRLFGLFPGQYWIVAIPPPDFRDYESHRKSPHSPDRDNNGSEAQPETRYLTTYYPGTFDAMQASSITLRAGNEMPINFTLAPARTYRVRGIVTGLTAGQKPSVELFSKAGDSLRANATDIGPDGQFEVRGVGPGSYVVRASLGTDSQALTAQQDVNVVAGDVEGVKLVPQPSFTISGYLRVADARGDLPRYVADLRPAEATDDLVFFVPLVGTNASVDEFGKFEWKDVTPGNYIVQVFGGEGQPFFLKSATFGGQDIITGFTASGPTTVDLVISTKAGTIEGVVVENQNDGDTDSANNDHPVPNATVVAVPEEKYRVIPDRFVTGATDQHGGFVLRGLAPGSYTVYAWRDLEDGVWRDAAFLKSQEANGTSVKVEEGSDQKVELKVSPADGEWR